MCWGRAMFPSSPSSGPPTGTSRKPRRPPSGAFFLGPQKSPASHGRAFLCVLAPSQVPVPPNYRAQIDGRRVCKDGRTRAPDGRLEIMIEGCLKDTVGGEWGTKRGHSACLLTTTTAFSGGSNQLW